MSLIQNARFVQTFVQTLGVCGPSGSSQFVPNQSLQRTFAAQTPLKFIRWANNVFERRITVRTHKIFFGLFLVSFLFPRISSGRPVSPREQISIEVKGKLAFKQGEGYSIEGKNPWYKDKDVQILLRVSENKVLVRKLQELEGQYVKVNGFLETYVPNGTSSCEQLGISDGFSIEGISEK